MGSEMCIRDRAKHREGAIEEQLSQMRLADIATELFMASCVYSRLSTVFNNATLPGPAKDHETSTGMLYLRLARQRNERRFEELKVNFDETMTDVADSWLGAKFDNDWVIKPEDEERSQ